MSQDALLNINEFSTCQQIETFRFRVRIAFVFGEKVTELLSRESYLDIDTDSPAVNRVVSSRSNPLLSTSKLGSSLNSVS